MYEVPNNRGQHGDVYDTVRRVRDIVRLHLQIFETHTEELAELAPPGVASPGTR